ncbi:PP2C family protein-serine/threonine phosphatase [Streptomyces sp. PU-14G]|uniref:PP2C family protein-serine/threonine phosphatase n=1 Tax=Streptomyces sp. PU-14G TaxID=2800808 RepID=UPI0034DF6E4E
MRPAQLLSALRRSWQGRHALLALPLGLIVAVTVVDILAPRDVHLGPLLVAAPAVAAAIGGARLVTGVGALAVVAQLFIGVTRRGWLSLNHELQVLSLALVTVVIAVFCSVRERHGRELTQLRSVAAAAQSVILRPLPGRIGPLRLASVYLAAEAEAQIGGDLYAAARVRGGTRLLIGDVRGKGLAAVSDAAIVLGAFREAAHRHADLAGLTRDLERSLSRALGETADGSAGPGPAAPGASDGLAAGASAAEPGAPGSAHGPQPDEPDEAADEPDEPGEVIEVVEDFVTAAVLEIPDDEPVVRVVNCGHPPPLLLRGHEVTGLPARQPGTPLGLGGFGDADYRIDTFSLDAGDVLLLYTDGVIEARDGTGDFYPLSQRLGACAGEDPRTVVQRVRDDLLTHTGGSLDDDAAMIALSREPLAPLGGRT